MGSSEESQGELREISAQQMNDWLMYDRWPMEPWNCDDEQIDRHLENIGTASNLDLRERVLVRKLIRMLASRIVYNTVSPKHLVLIGNYLVRLMDEDDYRTSLIVLGRADRIKRGAPSKDEEQRWKETRELYEWHIEMGDTDDEALHKAWETWVWDFNKPVDQQKTREAESKQPAGDGKNAYQQQIEMLKSRLNRSGSREPAKKGRKSRE